MKQRRWYLLCAAALLLTEILIGAFCGGFVRIYLGDVLVTVLLCCLFRCVFPKGMPWMPAGVFLFSVAVECFQSIHIPALEGTVLQVILGSTFDGKDLICYGIGCLCFWLVERYAKRALQR